MRDEPRILPVKTVPSHHAPVRVAALDGVWDSSNVKLVRPIIRLLQTDEDEAVEEEPAAAEETTEPAVEEPAAEAPFITTEIAILIAVVVAAIIGIVAYWALRKRK